MKDGFKQYFQYIKNDIPAGLVVFLVALPLCLGIALASGAPLFSGIITGVIGGVIVALLSGSQLAVSGPAAGLTVIVLNGITTLDSFEIFLVAVVLAGLIQLILGVVKAGMIGKYFPSSVIKGMLAAIGLILILKQIPHFLGVDQNFFGDDSFRDKGQNTFSAISFALSQIHTGAFIVGVFGLLIILVWEQPLIRKQKFLSLIPGALIAVLAGLLLNQLFHLFTPGMAIGKEHLVSLPSIQNMEALGNELHFPAWNALANTQVYTVAITIAVVASLETLLSIDATDKLDPLRRRTPMNRELIAQGIGNTLCGLVGGIPMTAVIVRSSANITAGGKTKMAAFYHGIFLILCVIGIPHLLNLIPLSSLAAILLVVGYKLSKASLYKMQYKLGYEQFIPFIITVLAILFTDLLYGIMIGMAVGIFFILKTNYKIPFFYKMDQEANKVQIDLSEHVTFLNKGRIIDTLDKLPENILVVINGKNTRYFDQDVLEILHQFERTAKEKNIILNLQGIPKSDTSGNGSEKKIP